MSLPGSEAGAYYNEFDRHAAAWLRNLADAGRITPGTVDEGDIRSVTADVLRGLRRCHFFAGIGGWELALYLAGWPADRPVWTGSCPCQPYSDAGKGLGDEDPRNLWPEFRRLIAECLPPTVFGEQVASKAGRRWLAGVRADLEALGYAVGSADLCSAGVGSPNIRQRLYWVAYRDGDRCGASGAGRVLAGPDEPERCGEPGGMADSEIFGRGERQQLRELEISAEQTAASVGDDVRVGSPGVCSVGRMGDTLGPGWEGCRPGTGSESRSGRDGEPVATAGPWSDFDIVHCRDGKSRRVESRVEPLVDGFPGRVVELRGYGNAINPYVGAEFIRAFLEAEGNA